MFSAILGLFLGISIILWARSSKHTKLILNLNLASFPLYYIAFAALFNQNFISREFFWGIPFFLAPLLLLLKTRTFTLLVLSVLYIAHGFYDIFHHTIVSGDHVPHWYPNLCAALDFIVGIYLLVIAATNIDKNFNYT